MHLTVSYTYYNNKKLLKEVAEYYDKIKAYEHFKFMVMDDGSQEEPIELDDLPEYWTILRKETDDGWGNEVCRNIMMREVDTDWVALLDLDYIIDLEDPDCFKAMTETLKMHDLWRCRNIWQAQYGKRTAYNSLEGIWAHEKVVQEHDNPKAIIEAPINSFIVSTYIWRKCTYGYDMAYGYAYGNDATLAWQFDTEPQLEGFKLRKIALQASPNHSINDEAEYIEFRERHKYLFEKYRSYRKFKLDNKLNAWRWLDPMEHIKECIDWPEYKRLR